MTCICGNQTSHTAVCKSERRREYVNARKRERRKYLRAKHICTYEGCGDKIIPKVIYNQFCDKHKPKRKEDLK